MRLLQQWLIQHRGQSINYEGLTCPIFALSVFKNLVDFLSSYRSYITIFCAKVVEDFVCLFELLAVVNL